VKYFDAVRARLAIVIRPEYWLQNDALSVDWDQELNWLLDHGYHFVQERPCVALLGPYEVWTQNHPYASFTFKDLRPTRRTIRRAYQHWRADVGVTRDGIAEIRTNRWLRTVHHQVEQFERDQQASPLGARAAR
jgi:hypothetical protein